MGLFVGVHPQVSIPTQAVPELQPAGLRGHPSQHWKTAQPGNLQCSQKQPGDDP